MVPKGSSNISRIELLVDADALIQAITLIDYFDTVTMIEFTDIEVNPLISTPVAEIAAQFVFEPPEGTEIISQ